LRRQPYGPLQRQKGFALLAKWHGRNLMPKRLHHIEQLRGIAAFAVVGFHSLAYREAASLNPTLVAAQKVFVYGWLGVHIFFAISGWCIAQRIATAYERMESPVSYLGDRALRVFPTYWAVFGFALLMLGVAAPFNGIPFSRNIPHRLGHWLAELTLTQPAFGYGSMLFVSWTLYYELSFYTASAIALVLRRLHFTAQLLLLLGGLVCLIVSWFPPTGILIGLSLWPHFFIGTLAWWSVCRRPNAIWVTAVILASIAISREASLAGSVAFATALFLVIAGLHPPRLPLSLGKWFSLLGSASYSIYLVHVPIMSPFFNLVSREISMKSNVYTGIWILGIALAIVAGIAVHKVIEIPCERWRHQTLAARSAAMAIGKSNSALK
jgi:exopolysaccharide production protein ExoZ